MTGYSVLCLSSISLGNCSLMLKPIFFSFSLTEAFRMSSLSVYFSNFATIGWGFWFAPLRIFPTRWTLSNTISSNLYSLISSSDFKKSRSFVSVLSSWPLVDSPKPKNNRFSCMLLVLGSRSSSEICEILYVVCSIPLSNQNFRFVGVSCSYLSYCLILYDYQKGS